jgi:hypothetical protein
VRIFSLALLWFLSSLYFFFGSWHLGSWFFFQEANYLQNLLNDISNNMRFA